MNGIGIAFIWLNFNVILLLKKTVVNYQFKASWNNKISLIRWFHFLKIQCEALQK